MGKKIKFYNFYESNNICIGILEEDVNFTGGYKIIYDNSIFSIGIVKILEDE